MTPLIDLIAGRPRTLSDAAWRDVLELADRTQSTALLQNASEAPDWVRTEVQTRVTKVEAKRPRLLETYRSAAKALDGAGVEFVLVKGFTHEVDAGIDGCLRAQGDIDLLCPPEAIPTAERALLAAGFAHHDGPELSDNHARPMLMPHNWRWRGDYFDPEQPVPIELHHSLWNPKRDRIETPGVDAFWERRTRMETAGMRVPVLCAEDRLAAAAMHLLRHILRGSMRPGHAWELAQMLGRRSGDAEFWRAWAELHPLGLRQIEAVAFRFAVTWFGGRLPDAAEEALSSGVRDRLDACLFGPVENLTAPNKDVLWLHLALLPNWMDKLAVLRRRLAPVRAPSRGEAQGSYAAHIAGRVGHHAVAAARTLTGSRTARSRASQTSD